MLTVRIKSYSARDIYSQKRKVNFPLTFTCSKSTMETLERGVKHVQSWRRSGVSIVKFEHISHLFLVFLLLNLSKYMLAGFLVPVKNNFFYFFIVRILQCFILLFQIFEFWLQWGYQNIFFAYCWIQRFNFFHEIIDGFLICEIHPFLYCNLWSRFFKIWR